MRFSHAIKIFWLPLAVFIMFCAAVAFRPLLPIDETRYMTVAWEMFLRQGWFQPLSVNFEPYHHKPPLLFWLINLSWSVFGISRWAGLIPVVLLSLSCVYLTSLLGRMLFGQDSDSARTRLVMAGSFPFMIYGTLVMFDFMVCAVVLLSLILLLKFRHGRHLHHMALLGLCLGLGVLAKGPVMYLYILPVALFAPLWIADFSRPAQWYGGILMAVLLSVLPVMLWLVPVLKASDNNFAFWLVWNQTAGRVTGNFSAAHARPLWFYLPIIPVLFMPWIFFPSFWRGVSYIKAMSGGNESLRFLAFWMLPVFIAFSLIGGKQPHYLVPLVPGAALIAVFCLRDMKTDAMAKIFAVTLALFFCGQGIASQTSLDRYDLRPIAEMIKTQPDRDVSFVRNYQGEIGFMARREKPVDSIQLYEIDRWFAEHPSGWAVIRFKDRQPEIEKYKKIISYPYRGKNIGIFEK